MYSALLFSIFLILELCIHKVSGSSPEKNAKEIRATQNPARLKPLGSKVESEIPVYGHYQYPLTYPALNPSQYGIYENAPPSQMYGQEVYEPPQTIPPMRHRFEASRSIRNRYVESCYMDTSDLELNVPSHRESAGSHQILEPHAVQRQVTTA